MAYTYKYIPSGAAIQNTAKNEYRNLLQEDLNQMFYEASDVYTIQEEISLASGTYQNVDVRLVSVVDQETGERQSDDFRRVLFKEIDHSVDIGRYYQFENNYWITINTEKINTLSQSANIRRCNNTLRWYDSNGGYHSIPCSIGYLIKENRDYSTAGSNMVVPSGMIEVLVQDNTEVKTLKPNQRFLFGNPSTWISYRVEGGGIANFNNKQTTNNNSNGLLRLSMAVDFTNYDNDDLTNGIADGLQYVYSLALNQDSISGNAGQTVQLQALVTVNGEVVSRTLVWSSSDTEKATVNSSGLVTFVATGTATITCALENRTSVNDTCSVTVGAIPVDIYDIRFSPTTNYVLEGEGQTYTCYLYKNNVQQADAFSFSLNAGTVPSANYTYTVLGNNSFRVVNNEMFLEDTLDITATTGARNKIVSITLKGAW